MTEEELKAIKKRLSMAPDPICVVRGDFNVVGDVCYEFFGLKEMSAKHIDFLNHCREDINNLLFHIAKLESKLDLANSLLRKVPDQEYESGFREGERYGRESTERD